MCGRSAVHDPPAIGMCATMNAPVPLLILSDSPSSTSGLGRIAREIAQHSHENMADTFRVGCIGYGGAGSRTLPYPQYFIHEINQWMPKELPSVWLDFAGDEKGILLVIWDASRLLWLTHPAEHCPDPGLRDFLIQARENKRMQIWTYSAIDAEGPNGKLSVLLKKVFEGFDRTLTYTKWSAGIVENTLGLERGDIPFLPHGIDLSVFHARTRDKARNKFGKIIFDHDFSIKDEALLIGIVATNQPRKDWPTAIEAVSNLRKMGANPLLWIHTDVQERHWSLSALIMDYGLAQSVILTTGRLTDEQMAWGYSACDVTLGIGLSEGFGYPIYESLACGTPCIHGSYGGGAEWLPDDFKIQPIAFRREGQFASLRPVYEAGQWTEAILRITGDGVARAEAELPLELEWGLLWPKWEKWLKEGLK